MSGTRVQLAKVQQGQIRKAKAIFNKYFEDGEHVGIFKLKKRLDIELRSSKHKPDTKEDIRRELRRIKSPLSLRRNEPGDLFALLCSVLGIKRAAATSVYKFTKMPKATSAAIIAAVKADAAALLEAREHAAAVLSSRENFSEKEISAAEDVLHELGATERPPSKLSLVLAKMERTEKAKIENVDSIVRELGAAEKSVRKSIMLKHLDTLRGSLANEPDRAAAIERKLGSTRHTALALLKFYCEMSRVEWDHRWESPVMKKAKARKTKTEKNSDTGAESEVARSKKRKDTSKKFSHETPKKTLRGAPVNKTETQTGRSNTKERNTEHGRVSQFVKNLLEMIQAVSTELASSSSQ